MQVYILGYIPVGKYLGYIPHISDNFFKILDKLSEIWGVYPRYTPIGVMCIS